MPSTIIGNPLLSGAQIIMSGCFGSGAYTVPVGGIQLRLDRTSSGNVYIGFSGSITATSGGMYLSGTLGVLDGMVMYPGDSYYIPRANMQISGTYNIYARHDAAASGQARLYYEFF